MKNNRITGPTDLPPSVRDALQQPMISHRSDAFKAVLASASSKLQKLLNAPLSPLFLTCSGTGGLEASILNTVAIGQKVLALSAGYYGDLFALIAKQYLGDAVTVQTFTPGTAIDLEVVQDLLQKHDFDAVLLTHSESSTGVLNPLPELAALIRRHSNALILVDAISSVGTTPIDMAQWGLDVVITVPQKGLMSPPGLAMVALSQRAMDMAHSDRVIGSFYFDFKRAWQAQSKNQTAFTPAMLSIWGLDAALTLIDKEGAQSVFDRHQRLALQCQQGALAAGFSLFAAPGVRARGITAIQVNAPHSSQAIQAYLAQKHHTLVGVGVGDWENRVLRIGHMGWVFETDIDGVVTALAEVAKTKL